MPSLARLNVTPVKGTALQHPSTVELTELGIPTNRRFHLVDQRGALYSGSDLGPLVQVRADLDPDAQTLTCSFPDGRVAQGPADDVGEAHVTDFYGRPVPGRFVHGAFTEAFSAYVGRPVRLVRADRDGDGPDVHRLSLVSLASVADLGARGGREDLDPRRFRMNLELEGCVPFEEDTWDGRRVRVGEAVVRVRGQVPRCVVTTQSPDTGLKDFDTLKQIAAFRPPIDGRKAIPFGMYAEVEVPGRAALGDLVEPLDD